MFILINPNIAIAGNNYINFSQATNQHKIQGKIVDEITGKIIPFCSITIEKSINGTSSNELGEFEFNTKILPLKITISHINYQSQSILVDDSNTNLEIKLTPISTVLDEVILNSRKNKRDLYAINLAKKAFRKISIASKNRNKYGKAFYRQKTKSNNDFTEFSEIIYDARYNLGGIESWGILEGRYALKEASVNNKNFTRFSQLLKSFQPDTDDLIFPLHKNLDDYYDVRVSEVYSKDNAKIAVLSFTPHKFVKKPIFKGEAYINTNTNEVLKITGFINKDDFQFIKFTEKNATKKNYNLTFDIAFKKDSDLQNVIDYINVNQTFDYYNNEEFQTKIETNSNLFFFEYYTPTSRKKLGGQFKRNQSDWTKLNQIGYNKKFWEENPIVRRTPVEEEVIAAFDKTNSFESIFLNSKNQISSLSSKLNQEPFILTFDQNVRKYNSYNPTEKVYLHTDNNYYTAGEKIRFNAFVTLGTFLNFSSYSKTLYVELVDINQNIVQSQTLTLNNGKTFGAIETPQKIAEGNYQLRAYTNWMKNFDANFFFKKNIKISSIYSTENKSNVNINNKIDLQFFPEGGDAIINLTNRIAFKAINNKGDGIKVTGKVFNSKRKQVASIRSSDNGTGSFNFKPKEGETYYAELSDKSTYALNKIKPVGYSMLVNNLNPTTINVKVQASTILKGRYFYIIGQMQNAKYFQGRYLFNNKSLVNIEIPKTKVPSGILTLTLFDSDMKPWAERLVFINNQNELIINAKIDTNSLNTGKDIKVDINVTDANGKPVKTNLSMAITKGDNYLKNNSESNILSYLLLESELKGNLINPHQYFVNQERATVYNLDLLMLTNGWRRFNWQKIRNKQFDSIKKHSFTNGFSISGIVTDKNNRILTNTSINMVAKSKNGVSINSAKTNNKGEFTIEHLFHIDSTEITFNGYNAKRNPIDINVTIKKQLKSRYPLKFDYVNGTQINTKSNESNRTKIIIPEDQINYQGLNLKDRTLLNEVVITGKVKRKKASRSVYGFDPDETVFLKENDENFVQVLNRTSGIRVVGAGRTAKVSIRGFGSPLWVLDGVPLEAHSPHPLIATTNLNSNPTTPSPTMQGAGPVPDVIANLDTEIIERIEVLKGGKAAIYGARGNNGVILIYTKVGSNNSRRVISPEFEIMGLRNAKDYYIPRYTAKKSNNEFSTLYWNPNVMTDENGNASIIFSNKLNAETVQLAIETLSEIGQLGVLLKSYTKQ